MKKKIGDTQLFYRLTQNGNDLLDKTCLPFKTISFNSSPRLDLVAELQNLEWTSWTVWLGIIRYNQRHGKNIFSRFLIDIIFTMYNLPYGLYI